MFFLLILFIMFFHDVEVGTGQMGHQSSPFLSVANCNIQKKNSLPKIRLCNLYAKQSGLVAIMALETVGACLLILKLTLRDPVFLTIRLMSSSSKNLIVFYCRLLNTGLFSKADRL